MTNGLCLSPTEGTWYRGGCTDEQYQKTGCPNICDTTSRGAHVGVSVCASRVFACYSLDNCSSQNFTVSAYRAVTNAARSTDLFDSGATATTSTTTSPSTGGATDPTCTSTQQANQGISTGAGAGIGVGVGLPLTIAVGALAFMLMREKKKSRDVQAGYQQQHHYSKQPGYNQKPYTDVSSPWGKSDRHYGPTAEAPGQMISHDLSDIQDRHELGH
ncbi:hypothetical protein INS49_006269 [Diaporthe citri]|uniref:uncharacterized protein n=1 Tax=Diaporthe citri TaxID=83186 RepID=UPI001C824092|nr:uncharacterized protein INS49_006269 [Diaporthe citri]KAG6364665.1 hypothetical protein INS49_006269 [Diaporthe citri]